MDSKRKSIITLLIFILVICGIGGFMVRDLFDTTKQLVINNGDTKPHLWLWSPVEYNSTNWGSFHSRSNTTDIPIYIQMCIETVKKHCNKYFQIHIINNDTIKQYLPNCQLDELKYKNKNYNYDILVSTILNKYGGIWLPASTIVLRDIRPLYNYIMNSGLYFGGFSCDSDEYICLDSSNPDRAIFIAPKHSPVIHEWYNSLSKMKDTKQNDYIFNKRGSNSLKQVLDRYTNNTHLFNASMSGTRDCKLKLIGADSLLSNNIGSVANVKNLYMINFDRNKIKNNFKYNWFERANYDEIIKSTLWFTLLYRASMDLEINLDDNIVGKSNTRNS